MATYSRPGVFINELPLLAAPVQGTATATAAGAVIAAFAQGPEVITKVTSWYDFSRRFGGYNAAYPASFQVASFFKNGGNELYVRRILGADAIQATAEIPQNHLNTTTVTKVVSGFSLTDNVASITTSTTHGFSVGDTITISGLTDTGADLNGDVTIATTPTTSTFTFALTHADINAVTGATGSAVKTTSTASTLLTLKAKNRGQDGANLRVKFVPSTAVTTAGYWDLSVYLEGATSSTADDVLVEQFNAVNLSDSTSSDFITSVLSFNSLYIEVDGDVLADPDNYGPVSTLIPFTNGTPDGDILYEQYTGDSTGTSGAAPATLIPANAAVFKEFEAIDQPLVFFLPDVVPTLSWAQASKVYNMLIACSESTSNVVVVETTSGKTVTEALTEADGISASSRAAVYYPHVFIQDPLGKSSGAVRKIGPSGAVTGIYLGTDTAAGPFKAPAGVNARISEAIALERALSPAELDQLNTGVSVAGSQLTNINAIRNLPGAGIVVMGGRTTKQDGTADRYINMRRSLIYIEKRLNDLLQFAVFENNTEVLWARINTVIGGFLNEYRNQGGLRGTTAAASFYVKCDEENNTPNSIAAGEVHVEVGVALEYPAEFVVINLSQKTAE